MAGEELKNDGWSNLYSSIGKKGKDKSSGNFFESPDYNFFSDLMLSKIYTWEGLGAGIIDRPADDMTRAWFDIQNDTEGKIQEELKRLKAHNMVNMAIKYARLYRGAVVVMFFEGDSTDLSKPLPKNIRGIKFLRVYSAARIQTTTTDIVSTPDSEYFDEIEVFTIFKKDGSTMSVHASRCLVFKGETPPDEAPGLDLKYKYWGLPVLMRIWDRLSNYGIIEKSIANLMQESSIGKYTFLNLIELLAQNDEEGIKKIYQRLEIINTAKSVINAVILADGEDYTRDNLTFSGIPEVVDRMMMNLSSVANIPVSILFGRSPAGMNATGESDFRGYYDAVRTKQTNYLYHLLKKLVDTIALYTKVNNPIINFNPLQEANEKQAAEIRKMNTESDKLDLDMGLYTAEQILERRGEIVDTGE